MTTTVDQATIDQLTQYIVEAGYDPEDWFKLDGEEIDASFWEDPIYQAYLQLAMLKLYEILDPLSVQAAYAAIGPEELDDITAILDEVQRISDADYAVTIDEILADSPELAAFFALTDGDVATDANELLAALDEVDVAASSGSYQDEQARDFARSLNLGGEWWYLIETEEGLRSTQNALFESLAEDDKLLSELTAALESGEMSAEAFSSQADQVSAYREIKVSLIKNLEDAWTNILELFSQLKKAQEEGAMAVIRNLNVGA